MSGSDRSAFLHSSSLPGWALAQLRFEPYASGGYEYQLKHRRRRRQDDTGECAVGDPQRDDRLRRGHRGSHGEILWSRQTFSGHGRGAAHFLRAFLRGSITMSTFSTLIALAGHHPV